MRATRPFAKCHVASAAALVLLGAGAAGCLTPVKALVRQQREEATHYDGPRCPMYPSCSAWGESAIDRYGWLGVLLTVDRLFFRESGHLYEKYHVAPNRMSRSRRYFDPVEDSTGSAHPDLFSDDFPSLR